MVDCALPSGLDCEGDLVEVFLDGINKVSGDACRNLLACLFVYSYLVFHYT